MVASFPNGNPFGWQFAALEGGGFITAWQAGEVIRVQRFTDEGEKSGDEAIAVSPQDQWHPIRLSAITPTLDGGYVLGWMATVGTYAKEPQIKIFTSTGQPVGEEVVVDRSGRTDFSHWDLWLGQLTLGTLDDGRIVATWLESTAEDTGQSTYIDMQIFSPSGEKLTEHSSLGMLGEVLAPRLSVLQGGRFAVTWTSPDRSFDQDSRNAKYGVFAQILDAGGEPVPSWRADMLEGTSASDLIDGLAGNDTIFGYGGDDTLIGGHGRDTLVGGTGMTCCSVAARAMCSMEARAMTRSMVKPGATGYSAKRGQLAVWRQ